MLYDQAGSDRGNALKTTKKLASYDADGSAAMNPDLLDAACFYATDIHKGGLGEGMHVDSLERAKDIRGERLMIWAGRTRTSRSKAA